MIFVLLFLVSPCFAEDIEQGTGKVRVHVSDSASIALWQRQLSQFFLRTTTKKRPGTDGWLDLTELLPDWMVRVAGKKAPVSTNCWTTAFYVLGLIDDPFGFDTAADPSTLEKAPLLFVSEWLRQGKIKSLPWKAGTLLELGDILASSQADLTPDSGHYAVYLGNGLIFENNADDFVQGYRFRFMKSRLEEKEFSIVLRRVEKPWDMVSLEANWSKQFGSLYDYYQSARTVLWRVFEGETGESFAPKDKKDFDTAVRNYSECLYGYRQVLNHYPKERNSPRDEFYVLCAGTLHTYLYDLVFVGRARAWGERALLAYYHERFPGEVEDETERLARQARTGHARNEALFTQDEVVSSLKWKGLEAKKGRSRYWENYKAFHGEEKLQKAQAEIARWESSQDLNQYFTRTDRD